MERGQAQGTLVIIPTYNERANIPDVLVVDDNSPDGTAAFVRKQYERSNGVKLLQREKKLGLGTAYKAGFHYAIQHNYNFAITMDADLSHDPAVIPDLQIAILNADLVVGSRYVPNGAVSQWGWLRKFISRSANMIAHHFLGMKAADCTSGFRIYRTEALNRLDFSSIHADGYSYLIEILFRATKLNLAVGEVPILFVDRERGKSKISQKEILPSPLPM